MNGNARHPGAAPAATSPGAAVRVTASPVADVEFAWTETPQLSIVIVTYGTGTVLERCVDDLAASLAADRIDAEVIVVDNPHPERGSWAGDRLRLTTSGIRIVRPGTNLGFGGGNNLGVGIARSERICLLNPDVFVRPGQFATLLEVADRHPDDIVAPAFVWPDGSVQEYGFRLLADGSPRAVEEPGADFDYCSAACWLLSTSMFAELGGFDDVFHPAYYEDVDFVFRARTAGREIHLVDEVRVVHAVHSELSSGWGEPTVDAGRQRQRFVERWGHLLADRPPS